MVYQFILFYYFAIIFEVAVWVILGAKDMMNVFSQGKIDNFLQL